MNNLSDTELMYAHNAGDEPAKDAIIERHRPRVVQSALRCIGDADAAEAIADGVFHHIFDLAHKFEPETAELGVWITWKTVDYTDEEMQRRLNDILGRVTLTVPQFNCAIDHLIDESCDAAELNEQLSEIKSYLESVTMNAVIDRLIVLGYSEKVWEAGKFASLKAEGEVSDLKWTPDSDHPTNVLFSLINKLDDAEVLEAIWDYIFDNIFDDSEFDLEFDLEEVTA